MPEPLTDDQIARLREWHEQHKGESAGMRPEGVALDVLKGHIGTLLDENDRLREERDRLRDEVKVARRDAEDELNAATVTAEESTEIAGSLRVDLAKTERERDQLGRYAGLLRQQRNTLTVAIKAELTTLANTRSDDARRAATRLAAAANQEGQETS